MFAAVPVGAETNREKTVAEIRAVIVAQEAAWNRGDVDAFMNGYAHARTTVFVSGDMVTRGWQTVRDRYKKKYATAQQMGQLKFSDLEITPLGNDAAVVLGRWGIATQSRSSAWTIYAHFPAYARRLADCARPYIGGNQVGTRLSTDGSESRPYLEKESPNDVICPAASRVSHQIRHC